MIRFTLCLLTAMTAITAYAQEQVRRDVLLIERVEKSDQRQLPARGLTMTRVAEQFGEPNSKTEAVGRPPISRWHYTDFTVYFEDQWVIDAVVNSLTETEQLVRVN